MNIAEHSVLKDQLVNALTSRLESDDPAARNYVLTRFMSVLRKLRPTLNFRLSSVLQNQLRRGDRATYDALSFLTDPFTGEIDEEEKWSKELAGCPTHSFVWNEWELSDVSHTFEKRECVGTRLPSRSIEPQVLRLRVRSTPKTCESENPCGRSAQDDKLNRSARARR